MNFAEDGILAVQNACIVDLRTLTLEQVIDAKLAIDLGNSGSSPDGCLWRWAADQLERPLLRRAFALCGRNQVTTALVLNINRTTLRKRLAHYGLLPVPRDEALDNDTARGMDG